MPKMVSLVNQLKKELDIKKVIRENRPQEPTSEMDAFFCMKQACNLTVMCIACNREQVGVPVKMTLSLALSVCFSLSLSLSLSLSVSLSLSPQHLLLLKPQQRGSSHE